MDGQPEGWGRNFVGEPFEEIHGTLCGSNYGSIAADIARYGSRRFFSKLA